MGGDKMEGRGWFWRPGPVCACSLLLGTRTGAHVNVRDADVGARHVRLAHVARYSGSSAAWQAPQGRRCTGV
jgi:hypothetical protein